MVSRKPESRYRSRILAIGATGTFLLFVIGSPIYNNRIESDLERRVPAELAESGFGVVTARFSGQDGVLRCERPLVDPEAAVDAAYDVWGVHSIELERNCRITSVDGDQPLADVSTTATDAAAHDGSVDDDASSETSGTVNSAKSLESERTSTSLADAVPDFGTVGDVVSTDPQFSAFAVLARESDLGAGLANPAAEPITVFAPTTDSFENVAADRQAMIRSDATIRDRVLKRHLVSGAITELQTGTLTTIDGDEISVVVNGDVATVDGALIGSGPIIAGNGVVYGIDTLLIPTDIDFDPAAEMAEVAAVYSDGTITLTGVVATEVERSTLIDIAAFAVGADAVVDELTIDAEIGLSAENTAALAEIIGAMGLHLISGQSGFDGMDLYARGIYATEEARDAFAVIAGKYDIATELEMRVDATEGDAVALEAELNEYVAANPIQFEPSSAVLDASATEIIDGLASRLTEFGGLTVVIEGHTDSDGAADANLSLSQQRAAVVRDALIAAGVDEAMLTFAGFGSEQPVLVDGVEDKALSRRVEFSVAAS